MKFCHNNGFLIENWFWFFKVSYFSSNNMLLKNLQLYFSDIFEWVKQIWYFSPAVHSKVFFYVGSPKEAIFFDHHQWSIFQSSLQITLQITSLHDKTFIHSNIHSCIQEIMVYISECCIFLGWSLKVRVLRRCWGM